MGSVGNIQYLYFFVIRLSLIATCDIHRWVAGADLGLGVVDIHSDHRAHVARLHLCEQDHCRPLVGPAHTPTLQNEEICQSNGHGFESHVFYSELWGAQGFTVQYVKERKNFFFFKLQIYLFLLWRLRVPDLLALVQIADLLDIQESCYSIVMLSIQTANTKKGTASSEN